MNNSSDRAEVALITQSTIARLARLRAVLCSTKQFRDYVCGLSGKQTEDLLKEIIPPHLANEKLIQQVKSSFTRCVDLCKEPDGFVKGDTPLHTAIKLGEYRYEETLKMFSQFLNVKNKAGKTPLDVALGLIEKGRSDLDDVQKNGYLIIQHLLENDAHLTKKYLSSELVPMIQSYAFKNPFLEGIKTDMNYQVFKNILRDIGEDHRFSLKAKKDLARECIEQFIEVNKYHPEAENRLRKLKMDVNGYSTEEESASIKYIRQLRSNLWIIRQIRGLYGWTSTQWDINSRIDKAIDRNQTKKNTSFSFFSYIEKAENYMDSSLENSCFVI